MSNKERFEQRYESGQTPWELSRADHHLVEFVENHLPLNQKVMDIGCGTGSNARWLAEKGHQVFGVDFSPRAIKLAIEKSSGNSNNVQYMVKDFLDPQMVGHDFDFIFDRGCFHSFDSKQDRSTFAQNVSAHLKGNGRWLSILGNSDAPPRDDGPPVRSAGQIVEAVEPFFELIYLKSDTFDSNREAPARCWLCLMKKRKTIG